MEFRLFRARRQEDFDNIVVGHRVLISTARGRTAVKSFRYANRAVFPRAGAR
jgi:hypothetical protein